MVIPIFWFETEMVGTGLRGGVVIFHDGGKGGSPYPNKYFGLDDQTTELGSDFQRWWQLLTNI